MSQENVEIVKAVAAGGTRLTQTDDIDWKIPKLMFPLARLMVSRDISTQLASLKRTLEASLSE